MLYSDLTKPHLWPSDTLTEARKECVQRLANLKTGPELRARLGAQLAEIEVILSKRNRARLRRP